MTDYDRLNRIVDGLIRKFPASCQLMHHFLGRLTEEVGELAEQVNHHYGGAMNKQPKLGEPSRDALADEVRDVLVATLSIARFAKLEPELSAAIQRRYDRLIEQGFLLRG